MLKPIKKFDFPHILMAIPGCQEKYQDKPPGLHVNHQRESPSWAGKAEGSAFPLILYTYIPPPMMSL